MTRYVVTIEPEDPSGGPKTTIRVDSAPTPRAVELTVSMGGGGDMPSLNLPPINLDTLVAAFAEQGRQTSGGERPARTATGAQRPSVAEGGTAGTGGPAGTGGQPPTAPAPAPDAGTRGGAGGRVRKSTGKRATRATAKSAKKAKATRGSSAAAGEPAGRSYRRMPDATELIAAYRDAESVTGLAERYGVPRHTMNGWLGRLRREGLIERREAKAGGQAAA